jgi:hypothetical protein
MPMGNFFPAAFSFFIDWFSVIFFDTSMFWYHYVPLFSIKQGQNPPPVFNHEDKRNDTKKKKVFKPSQ